MYYKNINNKLNLALVILTNITILVFIINLFNFNVAISGLRWSIPFFLIFSFINVIDDLFLLKISKLLAFLITLNLLVQIYFMFNTPAYLGTNVFGLSGRLGGFFALPSIAGAFGAFSYFFIKYFLEIKKPYKAILLVISITSIFLSMSSTGVGLLIVLFLMPFLNKFGTKYLILLLVIIIPVIIFLFSSLDLLTGRSNGDSTSSLSTRINIFFDKFTDLEIISSKFGSATNTAISIIRKDNIDAVSKNAFISDSMFTSVLTNYGLLFFIIYLIILFSNIIKSFKSNDESKKVFMIMIFLASISLIITEIFPINILIAILIAYYITIDNNQKKIFHKIN